MIGFRALFILSAIALDLLWAGAAQAAKPNIIVVLVDDMPAHMLWAMPHTQKKIGRAGVTFAHAFTEFSLCCPSRATFLTGRYAHNHHVESNGAPNGGFTKFRPLQGDTIAVRLQAAGYRTAMVGKYLNGYPPTSERTHVPPGWTTWVAIADRNIPFFDTTLNRNGVLVRPIGYQTDVLAAEARAFIDQSVSAGEPFFLWLSFYAPHQPSTPAPRHEGLFIDAQAPRTPAFNERNVSDKPPFLQFPLLDAATIAQVDADYAQMLRCLQAVDEAVRAITGQLKQLGSLDNTYIIFWSDNGFHNGEHRLAGAGFVGGGKQLAYDVDLRIPILVRGPGVPKKRVDDEHMIVNVDLAPTIMKMAGLGASDMDGRSFLPLLRKKPKRAWRHAFPLVKYPDPLEPQYPGFVGVRTERYTWVEWDGGERELYDHARDPDELKNRASSAKFAEVRSTLSDLAARLHTCLGRDCRTIENDQAP
jgi:arylsulfatase A-like enzyme